MIAGPARATRFFLARLAAQIDNLLLDRYPGDHPGPPAWLKILRGLVDTAHGYLDAAEAASSASALSPANLVRDAGVLGIMAYEHLNMMGGTGMADLPYPIVAPMQRWFEQVGLQNSTIFRAELAANYEIRPVDRRTFERIRNPSPSLTAALSAIRWPLSRITVPTRALGMLPHFAIVAHEIGHPLCHKVPWDFGKFSAEETAFHQRLDTELGGSVRPEVLVHTKEVFRRWLHEFGSDAFGLLIAGPAFFFALCGFLQTAGVGLGVAETHPPNELRRDALHRRLGHIVAGKSFSSVFHDVLGTELSRDINSALAPLPPLADLQRALATRAPRNMAVTPRENAAVLAHLVEYFKVLADDIFAQAEQYFSTTHATQVYKQDRYEKDLREHLEPLIQAIPPIENHGTLESRQGTELATILNVGWVALLTRLDQLAVRVDNLDPRAAEKEEKLHSLLLKAVELAEAKRLWSGQP